MGQTYRRPRPRCHFCARLTRRLVRLPNCLFDTRACRPCYPDGTAPSREYERALRGVVERMGGLYKSSERTYRVKLSPRQAIIGFPKFGTIGIGFAIEEADWNTNLPYTSDAADIYEHIKHNKRDPKITKPQCLAAIRLIQDAARAAEGKSGDRT